MNQKTIAAIATPSGSGGIGIIKISGPAAINILSKIFLRKDKKTSALSFNSFYKSHQFYYGHIVVPSSSHIIDEALVTAMNAPFSHTGEDVAEIQSHAGQLVLMSILELVLSCGAELAEPGEFTKRAFINGKIDLTQAEAVMDIINAKSENSLKIASSQIKGDLKNKINDIYQVIKEYLIRLEADIDFSDDTDENLLTIEPDKLISDIVKPINILIEHYKTSHIYRDGIRLSIIGRPNVGKSTLMNCLFQKERSIVTTIPGTTRDIISDSMLICGIPVIINDTAGIHATIDPVEKIGIKKTEESIEESDLILLLTDASVRRAPEDITFFNEFNSSKLILIINKIDLVDNYKNKINGVSANIPCIPISAKLNMGINDLKKAITKKLNCVSVDNVNVIVPNIRQKKLLEKAKSNIFSACKALTNNYPLELICIDLHEALGFLGEIMGVTAKADILGGIFENFCIGK